MTFERKISGTTVFHGRVFSVDNDEVELPGGARARRELVRHPGGVAVLAEDGQGRVVLVRQYRYGAGEETTEIPAGKLEPGEEPLAAGLRELYEETGYTAGTTRPLGFIWPTAAYCSEKIWLFHCTNLTGGQAKPDEGEDVRAELMPLDELRGKIMSGEVNDAKTIAAVMRRDG
ncbi:MAG: NUDIX hydrolase [Oscillospiraceae bacterium]|jgi:ADP-ribose pyrophosphatase|nr:NUDIX hydrolase [Oscillospiraceae bacterium]